MNNASPINAYTERMCDGQMLTLIYLYCGDELNVRPYLCIGKRQVAINGTRILMSSNFYLNRDERFRNNKDQWRFVMLCVRPGRHQETHISACCANSIAVWKTQMDKVITNVREQ